MSAGPAAASSPFAARSPERGYRSRGGGTGGVGHRDQVLGCGALRRDAEVPFDQRRQHLLLDGRGAESRHDQASRTGRPAPPAGRNRHDEPVGPRRRAAGPAQETLELVEGVGDPSRPGVGRFPSSSRKTPRVERRSVSTIRVRSRMAGKSAFSRQSRSILESWSAIGADRSSPRAGRGRSAVAARSRDNWSSESWLSMSLASRRLDSSRFARIRRFAASLSWPVQWYWSTASATRRTVASRAMPSNQRSLEPCPRPKMGRTAIGRQCSYSQWRGNRVSERLYKRYKHLAPA